MRIIFLLLLAWLCCCSTQVAAQDSPIEYTLYLRSGQTLVGEIVAYKMRDYVKLHKSADGITTTYPLATVARMEPVPAADGVNFQIPYIYHKPIESVLELQNGTVYRGEVLAYESGDYLKMWLPEKSVVTVAVAEVKSLTYESAAPAEPVIQEKPTAARWQPAPRKKPVYQFAETGWFNSTSFAFSFGKRDRPDLFIGIDPFFGERDRINQTTIGFNIQHITGYQFSRWAGLGIGASFDAYDLEQSESVLSVFGHYRAYLTQKIVAPYLAVNAGYGFPLRSKNQGINAAEGGVMFHPEVGLRLGAAQKTNFTFSVGYRFQKAYYEQEVPFSGVLEYRNVAYRRFLCALGLLF